MNLEEIQDLIEEDSKLDDSRLDWELLRIPSLHSKYYRLYSSELSALKKLNLAYFSARKKKTEYYLGKAPDEVYKEKPLDIKILKTDVDTYLDSDEELHQSLTEMELHKIKVDMVEKFLSSLRDRGFNIKTAVDFMKFKAGEY